MEQIPGWAWVLAAVILSGLWWVSSGLRDAISAIREQTEAFQAVRMELDEIKESLETIAADVRQIESNTAPADRGDWDDDLEDDPAQTEG